MAGTELAVVVLRPWRAFRAVHWHQRSRALWARQGRACARARARVCVLCTVTKKKAGLGPLRWRDHDSGHGEHIPASESSVGAHYGLEVARMAVQWRGVAVCYLIVRSVCF